VGPTSSQQFAGQTCHAWQSHAKQIRTRWNLGKGHAAKPVSAEETACMNQRPQALAALLRSQDKPIITTRQTSHKNLQVVQPTTSAPANADSPICRAALDDVQPEQLCAPQKHAAVGFCCLQGHLRALHHKGRGQQVACWCDYSCHIPFLINVRRLTSGTSWRLLSWRLERMNESRSHSLRAMAGGKRSERQLSTHESAASHQLHT
jgi:hypothetical protein